VIYRVHTDKTHWRTVSKSCYSICSDLTEHKLTVVTQKWDRYRLSFSTDYFSEHHDYPTAKFHEEHRAQLKVALENVALNIVATNSGAHRVPID
jgi:hypothetical protein